MDLSYALTWMVGTSLVFGLVASIQQWRLGVRGWFYVHAGLLGLLGILLLGHWEVTGHLLTLLWLAFVVLPGMAHRRAQAAADRQDPARAAKWSMLSALLHPFDGQRQGALLLVSQSHYDQGHVDEAKGALYPLLKSERWAERAKMELFRLDGRWSRIAQCARQKAIGTRDLQLAPLYLRAFAEVGDHEAMWQMYRELPVRFATAPTLRLQMAMFSGQLELVNLILTHYFPRLPQHFADIARATALYVAGQTAAAVQMLTLIANVQAPHAARAKLRLGAPPPAFQPSELSPANQQVLREFAHAIHVDVPRLGLTGPPRRPWATVALLTILVAVFLLGLPGGSTDPENLIRLGALVLPSELVGGGVAWRIVAAGFLHLGGTHLLMNCIGLYVLGKEIEQLWNAWVMLLLFLCSSIGSFGFAAAYVQATASDPRIFLGASSGVLGLVGALGAFLTTGYIQYRRQALKRRVLLVLAVVAAQFVFDAFTPVVSSLLHLSGLLIGALVAIPFSIVTWRRRLG